MGTARGATMNYKESSRSPHYGKIFAYDKNGFEIQELDILKLVVLYNGREYSIKQLLQLAADSEAKLAANKSSIESLEAASEAHEEQIRTLQQTAETLSQLVVLLNARIDAFKL